MSLVPGAARGLLPHVLAARHGAPLAAGSSFRGQQTVHLVGSRVRLREDSIAPCQQVRRPGHVGLAQSADDVSGGDMGAKGARVRGLQDGVGGGRNLRRARGARAAPSGQHGMDGHGRGAAWRGQRGGPGRAGRHRAKGNRASGVAGRGGRAGSAYQVLNGILEGPRTADAVQQVLAGADLTAAGYSTVMVELGRARLKPLAAEVLRSMRVNAGLSGVNAGLNGVAKSEDTQGGAVVGGAGGGGGVAGGGDGEGEGGGDYTRG